MDTLGVSTPKNKDKTASNNQSSATMDWTRLFALKDQKHVGQSVQSSFKEFKTYNHLKAEQNVIETTLRTLNAEVHRLNIQAKCHAERDEQREWNIEKMACTRAAFILGTVQELDSKKNKLQSTVKKLAGKVKNIPVITKKLNTDDVGVGTDDIGIDTNTNMINGDHQHPVMHSAISTESSRSKVKSNSMIPSLPNAVIRKRYDRELRVRNLKRIHKMRENEFKKDIARLMKENEIKTEENDSLQNIHDKMHHDLKVKLKQLNTIKVELDHAMRDNNGLKKEIQRIRHRVMSEEETIDSYDAKHWLEEHKKESEKIKVEHQESINRMQSQLEVSKQDVEILHEQISTYEDRMKEMKEQNEMLHRELKAECRRRCAREQSLLETNRVLKQEKNQFFRELNSFKEKVILDRKRKEEIRLLKELKDDLVSNREGVNVLKVHDRIAGIHEKWKGKVDQLQVVCDRITKEKRKAVKANQKLKKQIGRIAENVEEVQVKLNDALQTESEFEIRCIELEQKITDYEWTLETLKGENAGMRRELGMTAPESDSDAEILHLKEPLELERQMQSMDAWYLTSEPRNNRCARSTSYLT